jgi:hypothetical protein
MNTATISMLATTANDAVSWDGTASSPASALKPDKTGIPYAHKRCKATARSRPIKVPRKTHHHKRPVDEHKLAVRLSAKANPSAPCRPRDLLEVKLSPGD